MASWDYYGELDGVEIERACFTSSYASENFVYLSGSQNNGARVVVVADKEAFLSSIGPIDNKALCQLDEEKITLLLSTFPTLLEFEPSLSSEQIITDFITYNEIEERGFQYSLRHAFVSQYVTDLQQAHEIALKSEKCTAFLQAKNHLNRISRLEHTPPESTYDLGM